MKLDMPAIYAELETYNFENSRNGMAWRTPGEELYIQL